MEAFRNYWMILKIAFPIALALVVIFLAWLEKRNSAKAWKPTNLRSFPKSEAERIAEFRQKYVPRAARR